MKKSPVFDLDLIKKVYAGLPDAVARAREILGRPMTLGEKILYAHVHIDQPYAHYERGKDFVNFSPDRVAMQDATAQMALLQFSTCGMEKVAVPSTVHCDHLIQAKSGAVADLATAVDANKEVYDFLESISKKYGIGFWRAGAGIIHQVVLENYAFPGGMMIGTDSHTPNAGGLGMIAIGVGGADAVDVMAGLPWELKMPKLIGIKLTGKLNKWASAKDIILKVAGILTVKGGTDAIIEYFGEGAESLSATGKATICNMGAEIGATCSMFAYDQKIAEYLYATNRMEVAELADGVRGDLRSDQDVYVNPQDYYDRVIEINLDELSPYINGPYTPDLATQISEMADAVIINGWPDEIDVVAIGSCTNSSYQDIARALSVVEYAVKNDLRLKTKLFITPGSEMVYQTLKAEGIIQIFEDFGATVLANACGPCIGQWAREIDDVNKPNTIVTSYNRNFEKRNDGLKSTHAFVASPEIAVALSLAGLLSFNPLKDLLTNSSGKMITLDVPTGLELPSEGFAVGDFGYVAPPKDGSDVNIVVDSQSERLQLLEPFSAPKPIDFRYVKLLLKVAGKCTTDHISMAGKWLKYRGHLDNISDNMLIGAVNAFNGQQNSVKNYLTGVYDTVPGTQRVYKSDSVTTFVVGEENYGEGSSREHAAMEPRFLGVGVILVKSFARIHETNLKKQGVLALTFADPNDYEKVMEGDTLKIKNITELGNGNTLSLILTHVDGSYDEIVANHTYNKQQAEWFWAGGALNVIRANVKNSVSEEV